MLASNINRSQGHIGDVESGKCYPTFKVLNLIADACEVPLSFFSNTEIDTFKKISTNSFVAENTAYFISINRPEIIDAKYAMDLILSQPELMLNGEILSAESKIALANALQLGLSYAENIQSVTGKGIFI